MMVQTDLHSKGMAFPAVCDKARDVGANVETWEPSSIKPENINRNMLQAAMYISLPVEWYHTRALL